MHTKIKDKEHKSEGQRQIQLNEDMLLKDNKQGYGSTADAPSAPSGSPTNVQVVAPATLHAGYTFDAMYDGATFTVTVPEGGVVKGQRFIVPFVPGEEEGTVPEAVALGEPIGVNDPDTFKNKNNKNKERGNSGGSGGGNDIPTGVWRDSLCDCLRFGPCHPHFLNAWCCRPILIGQILTRMRMTWLGFRTARGEDNANNGGGNASEDDRWKSTFRNMVILTIVFYALMILTSPDDNNDSGMMVSGNEEGDLDFTTFQTSPKSTLNSIISSAMFLYTTYILIQLRATLRHVYSIPEESCLCMYQLRICGNNPREGICGSGDMGLCTSGVTVGWEDVCCAFWCPLCITGQMARHTVDYEDRGRRAVCCSNTGVDNWEEDEAYEGVVRIGEGSVLVV